MGKTARQVKRALRTPFEAALAWIARGIVRPLPRSAVCRLASFLGNVGYLFSGRMGAVARANLAVVFGDRLSTEEKERILRQSIYNFSLVALDAIWFSADTSRRIHRWVELNTSLAAVFPEHQPAVCLTAHFGNWEVLGHAVAIAGYPLVSVATPLKNQAVDRILRRAREAVGQIIIERDGAVRKMLHALRNNGRVAMLLDQNTALLEGGIFVDFFGVPATVSPAAASLAYRTQSRIVMGFCVPNPNGSYRVFSPVVFPPPDDGPPTRERIFALTQRIVREFEKVILEYPEYWLWMYKRWKHIRPGDRREGYPFYSSELRPDLIPLSYYHDL